MQPDPQQIPPVSPAPPHSPAPQSSGMPPFTPQQYPTGYYQPMPMMVQGPPTSGYAVCSLVFGILGAVGGWCLFGIPCIVAVICGHVALVETRGGKRAGRGMAIAGLILGYLIVGPALVFGLVGGVGAMFG